MADDETSTVRPGIGVDSRGGAVIDPTENVIALVKAGEATAAMLRAADQRFLDAQLKAMDTFQVFARDAETRFQNFARGAESKLSEVRSEAETRRIDQLAMLAKNFQDTIRDMLAESVRTTQSLVATQLVEFRTTFDTRVTKLESYQLTQAGRSSVADPATEAAMARLNVTMSALAAQIAQMQTGESTIGGRTAGRMDANSRLMTILMVIATVATPIIAAVAIFAMRAHI
jgi:hypothetical protein